MLDSNNFWTMRNEIIVKQRKYSDSLCLKKRQAKQRHKDTWEKLPRISEEKSCEPVEIENLEIDLTEVVTAKETDKKYPGRTLQNKEAEREMLSLNHCAEELKQRLHIVCMEKALYVYNGQNYDQIDALQLMMIYRDSVSRALHDVKTMNSIQSLYKFLMTDSEIYRRIDYSGIDELAVLRNGVFDVKKQKLKSHSEKYMFMFSVDANYTIEDETPVFDDFLESVTGGDEVLITRLWYLIAYLCMHSVAAKAFFVLGIAPDSGKSVFGKFIQRLFPESNVSSIALNDMGKDFALAPIVGAAVNISMDLPSGKLNTTAVSRLKMLTGDDLITIREKFVPEFRYYNRAKMLFASNHPICIAEPDEAFWNRLVYFPFNHTVPKKEQDMKLLDKILREKDAIVSKALRRAKKFVENNYVFPTTREIEETIAVWKGERNYSIENFLRDCCVINSTFVGEWTSDLYSAYEAYCKRQGKESITKVTFKMFLENQQGVKPKKFRKNSSDNPRHGFEGIKLLTSDWDMERGDEDAFEY